MPSTIGLIQILQIYRNLKKYKKTFMQDESSQNKQVTDAHVERYFKRILTAKMR